MLASLGGVGFNVVPGSRSRLSRANVQMSAEKSSFAKDLSKTLAKAAFMAFPLMAPLVAGARIDYEGKRHAFPALAVAALLRRSVGRGEGSRCLLRVCLAGVGYLGGSEKIDINNANVRVYVRFPGMYPTIAGKIVSHGPYKSVSELYSITGLTGGYPMHIIIISCVWGRGMA
jgi:hypothetical protein